MNLTVEKPRDYPKEKVDKLLERWAKGELLIDLLEEYNILRATLYVWANSDIDGLKARYKRASLNHDKAMVEKLAHFYKREDLVYYDCKGRTDTSRIRLAIEGTEKYLKLRCKYLLDKPEFQTLNLDLSGCKTAKDIQEILTTQSKDLTKTQIDTLLAMHAAMIRAEEGTEVKEKIDLALEKLKVKKLQQEEK